LEIEELFIMERLSVRLKWKALGLRLRAFFVRYDLPSPVSGDLLEPARKLFVKIFVFV